jgi:hypothetical protein
VKALAGRLCIVALAIGAPGACALAAGVYKCAGDTTGVPVYQGTPCAPGRELRDLTDAPSTLSVVPFARAPPPPATRTRPEKPPKAPAKDKARPAGDAGERRYVSEGMSEGQVLARLGAPDLKSGRGRTMRWTYLPAPADRQTVTVLRFEDGQVVSVDRRILR